MRVIGDSQTIFMLGEHTLFAAAAKHCDMSKTFISCEEGYRGTGPFFWWAGPSGVLRVTRIRSATAGNHALNRARHTHVTGVADKANG
jgi:hypothetical protein